MKARQQEPSAMSNKTLFRGAQPDHTNYARITKPMLVIFGMPMANDFLTWPRFLKELRRKIPQDAAVQRIANFFPQTKYEAENTSGDGQVRKVYPNGLRRQVYIPVVWRKNSTEPTPKEYLTPTPRCKADTVKLARANEGRTGHPPFSCPHVSMWLDSALYSIFFCPQRGVTFLTSDCGKRN